MEEIWKEVRPGIEVSSLGRVRQYLTGHFDGYGYLAISGGKRGAKRETIHSLVAKSFLGPRPKGAVIRHLNDNPLDNRAVNLAYGSQKDNWWDACKNGKVVQFCPVRAEKLKKGAGKGGAWWKGRKRDGQRGKAATR